MINSEYGEGIQKKRGQERKRHGATVGGEMLNRR